MTPEAQRIAIAKIYGWRMQKKLLFKKSSDYPKGYQGAGVYTQSGNLACFYDARAYSLNRWPDTHGLRRNSACGYGLSLNGTSLLL